MRHTYAWHTDFELLTRLSVITAISQNKPPDKWMTGYQVEKVVAKVWNQGVLSVAKISSIHTCFHILHISISLDLTWLSSNKLVPLHMSRRADTKRYYQILRLLHFECILELSWRKIVISKTRSGYFYQNQLKSCSIHHFWSRHIISCNQSKQIYWFIIVTA